MIMKKVLMVSSFALLLFVLVIPPALAEDEGPHMEALDDEWSSAGYVPAPGYGTLWTLQWGAWKDTYIAGDTARRWWSHSIITNLATYPLTEAVVTIRVRRVRLNSAEGPLVPEVGLFPNREASLPYVDILNSGDAWTSIGYYNGWYVIHLGTIEAGQTKKFLMNWWTRSDVYSWGFQLNLWYLPSA